MSKIEDILSDFSDYELAVFYKSKLCQYMSETQNRITFYVNISRGLNDPMIEKLIAQKPVTSSVEKSIKCPKCNSRKLLKTRVKWIIPAFKVGYSDEMASWKELTTGEATYKDRIECIVCGHVLFDPNNQKRPFYKKLLDLFFDHPLPI